MRKLILVICSAGVLGLCVYLQAEAPKSDAETVTVRVQLVDAATGDKVGGIIRVYRAGEDKPLPLTGLYDRLRGLKQTATLNLGRSYTTNQPVATEIRRKAGATIALVGISAVLSAVIGTMLGIAAAWR